jgi:hypothetical protein
MVVYYYYYFLESVMDRKVGIVIVVDRREPGLDEAIHSIAEMTKAEDQVLEFMTFQSNTKDMIHLLDTMGVERQQIQWKERKKEHADKPPMNWAARYLRISPGIKQLIENIVKADEIAESDISAPLFY